MTVSATQRYGHYTASGAGPYSYDYLILSAAEFEVYVDGSLATGYTLTGVGNAAGGTFTFFSAPASGLTIFHRGKTAQTQQTDYDNFTGLPFAATGHESALDKLTLLVQELYEQMSRRPQLATYVLSNLRNLVFPTPVPLKLWGWNANADGITYYDPAIIQVTPSLTAHVAWGETQVVIPTVGAAVQLTGAAVFPAGCLRVSAIVRVTTTFGNSLGLTTFSAGDASTMDRWGGGLARTSTAAPSGANNPGMWRNYELRPIASAEPVILTADTGTFDGSGAALVTGVYLAFTAA